jgi:hypothetical protein
MGAVLTRIDDPRDALERARRPELTAYARANGINTISIGERAVRVDEAPAILVRQVLRDRRLTRIPIARKMLGAPEGRAAAMAPPDAFPAANEVDATADLARQFAAAPSSPLPKRKPASQMTINELGAEMKRLKIKRDRRDNMITMRAKIEQHGQ